MKATLFMARNECVGCCLSCGKSGCPSKDSLYGCKKCTNWWCINNPRFYSPEIKVQCDQFCYDCPNTRCVEHGSFNPKKETMKYC